ncbi:MAG: DUF3108 domain-containing protein [Ramlibacter sp.]
MAGGTPLKPVARNRLLALLVIVLALHVVALQWLGRYLELTSALKPLSTPMFTRLLKPEAPATPPAATAPPAPAKPQRPAITSVATPVQRSQPAVAAAPLPAASEAVADASPEASAPTAPPVAARSPEPVASAASAPEGLSPAFAIGPTAPVFAIGPTPPASAPPADWPADTRVSYRLGGQFRSGELHGNARVQWQRQGSKYETRVDIDVTLLASLVLTSQGEVTPQGLYPRAYEELRRNGPRNNRLGNDTIVLADGRSVPRPPGVQDTASQFVELGHRFATGQEALAVGRSVSFWMARPGGVDLWTYDIVGRETLQTPQLGPIDAFHLKPRPIANSRGNIIAEMWFAPSLQYLPVRIKVSMGDATWVDLLVDRIEQR